MVERTTKPTKSITVRRVEVFDTLRLSLPILTYAKIRRLYAQGDVTQREIAEMFGIGGQNVSNIVRGNTWTHVDCAA